MLEQAGGMFDSAMQGINNPDLQSDLTQWNQGIQDSAQGMWNQQAQGGNLAGYDISGALNNAMGQNNNINPQNIQANTADANTIGPVQQSWANDVYNNRVGPSGSANQMNDMYRRQANMATQDMLGATDARAAAGGMGGGSAHGNAMGRGMEGINQNLQNQMATTSYDAYNRDLDRQLGIGAQADQYNQQRAIGDQNALNQANQLNQSTDLAAQQSNQNYAQNQQQLMQGLLGQQNQNQQNALSNTGAMAGLGNLGYQAAMSPFSAYSQLLQGMGPATVLSDSESKSKSRQGGL